jgi:hypothetical protein
MDLALLGASSGLVGMGPVAFGGWRRRERVEASRRPETTTTLSYAPKHSLPGFAENRKVLACDSARDAGNAASEAYVTPAWA